MTRSQRIPTYEVDLGVGIRAFFTGAAGGTSTGPWASLNLGTNVDDHPGKVIANRELVSGEIGRTVSFMNQVHGSHVVELESPIGHAGDADAMITNRSGVPLAVLVADCLPILLAAQDGPVAVVHAGRRGLHGGIIERTVEKMRVYSAGKIQAAIGPAICGQCYEVPSSLQDEVSARLPATRSTTSTGTPALDLPAGASWILETLGVVISSPQHICTMEDDRFFSYRRAKGQHTGRFAGVVMRET